MRYFRIEDSFDLPERWYLGALKDTYGIDVDPRLFTEGKKYAGNSRLRISVKRGINPLDFTLGSFDMPFVKSIIGEKIKRLAPAEIQRIPVSIKGHSDYEILNVLTVLKAINEDLSEITRWIEDDPQPEKVGTYFGIGELVLNEKNIGISKIFRLKDWELPLIVCEAIKQKLEELDSTGISFKELKIL
jgi:hypothetical protein